MYKKKRLKLYIKHIRYIRYAYVTIMYKKLTIRNYELHIKNYTSQIPTSKRPQNPQPFQPYHILSHTRR